MGGHDLSVADDYEFVRSRCPANIGSVRLRRVSQTLSMRGVEKPVHRRSSHESSDHDYKGREGDENRLVWCALMLGQAQDRPSDLIRLIHWVIRTYRERQVDAKPNGA